MMRKPYHPLEKYPVNFPNGNFAEGYEHGTKPSHSFVFWKGWNPLNDWSKNGMAWTSEGWESV